MGFFSRAPQPAPPSTPEPDLNVIDMDEVHRSDALLERLQQQVAHARANGGIILPGAPTKCPHCGRMSNEPKGQ